MASPKQTIQAAELASSIPRFDDLLSEVSSHSDGTSTIVDPILHPNPDLHPSTENATHQNRESPTILQEVEQHMTSFTLNDPEHLELTASYAASTTGSKTEYPDSANYSSLVSQNLHSLVNDASSSILNESATLTASEDIKGRANIIRYCVDLRERQPGLYKTSVKAIPLNPHQDMKTDFVNFFQCQETELFDVLPTPQCPIPLTIIKPGNRSLVLIIRFKVEEVFGCMMIGREASLTSGLRMCKHWVDKNFGASSSSHVCLLIDGHRLDEPRAFSQLSQFQVLDLVRGESLTLKLVCRVSQHSERVFYVDCDDTDYVRQLMEKFFQTLQKDQLYQNELVSPLNMRLTFGERIAFPEDMVRNLWNPKEKEYAFDSHVGDLRAGETFYVHFQPPDAVLVKLNFKSDLRKYIKSESVILLSPKATAEVLRQEISKVIHRDPLSFKMFISGRKIELSTDLQPLLTIPNCTVVVEQRSEILLKVETAPESAACLPINIHKYERVRTLKQLVCSHLGQPAHCIDLYHQQNRLDDRKDLRGCRLRNQDTVQALVLPNRIRVVLRLGTGHWEEIVVKDMTVTTVEHLIAYAQIILRSSLRQNSYHQKRELSLGQLATQCNTTTTQSNTTATQSNPQQEDVSCVPGRVSYKALLNGQVLCRLSSLRDAGVSMNSRVVLVQEETLCYNMTCQGRIPVFLAHDSTSYRPADRIMVMCDGTHGIYIKYPLQASLDPPGLMTCDQPAPIGIEACSPELKAQFPLPNKGGSHLSPHPHVCNVCKSASFPVFPAPTAHSHVSRSQSFNYPGNEFSGSVNTKDDSEMLSSYEHRSEAHMMSPEHRFESQMRSPEHRSEAHMMSPEHRFEPQMRSPEHRSEAHMMSPEHRSEAHMTSPEHHSEPQMMSPEHHSMPQMQSSSKQHRPEQHMQRSCEHSSTPQMQSSSNHSCSASHMGSSKHHSMQQMIDNRREDGSMDFCDGAFTNSPQHSPIKSPGSFLASTPQPGSYPGCSVTHQPSDPYSSKPQFYLPGTRLDDQHQEGKGNSVGVQQTPVRDQNFKGNSIHGQQTPFGGNRFKENSVSGQQNQFGDQNQNCKGNAMPRLQSPFSAHHQNFKANNVGGQPVPFGDHRFQANSAPREQTTSFSKQSPPANVAFERWDLNQPDNRHSLSAVPQSRRRHVSDYQCQSDGETRRKQVFGYKCQVSVEADAHGGFIHRTQVDHCQQLSDLNMVQGYIPSFLNRTVPLPSHTSPLSIEEGLSMPGVSPAEAFIKNKTLHSLAKNLGKDGENVMVALVNDFNAYQRIEQRHSHDMFRKYYDCLIHWRQKTNSKDCVKQLKRVLEENDRADLVDIVDKSEALEQGFKTAP